jgi:hypothetical protein
MREPWFPSQNETCDACPAPMTHYDANGQWCAKHGHGAPTITAEQMLDIVGLSSAQAFEMCAMVGHDLGKTSEGCLCERLRPEYARTDHDFAGAGVDCLICGEGRCYYLHGDENSQEPT